MDFAIVLDDGATRSQISMSLAARRHRNRPGAPSCSSRTLLACALLCGCDLQSGYEELGRGLTDRKPRLEHPGRRLTQLELSDFDLGGDREGNAIVGGLIDTNAGRQLTMIQVESGARCEVGPAEKLLFVVNSPMESPHALAVYFERLTAEPPTRPQFASFAWYRGDLAFADESCRASSVRIPDARLIAIHWNYEDSWLLVSAGSRALWKVDPWGETQTLVADAIDELRIGSANEYWSRESGALVLRDYQLTSETRFGEGVREFALSSDPNRLLAAFVDDRGLHRIRYIDQEPTSEALDEPDACGVRLDNGLMTYFSPCQSRRLVLRDLDTGQLAVVDEQVEDGYRLLYEGSEDGNLRMAAYYSKPDLPDARSTTYRRVFSPPTAQQPMTLAAVERVAEDVALDTLTIDPQRRRYIGGRNDAGGVLYELAADGLPRALAERVVELSYDGLQALAAFDGTVGDLVAVGQDGATTLLANGVPRGYLQSTHVLSAFDGSVGRLVRMTSPGSPLPTVEPVAERVPMFGYDSFGATDIGYGFAVLSELNDETAVGRLGVTWNGEQVDLGPGVREFSSVYYPKPGVLYAVRDGKRTGIWYAMVRE